ncbi:class I SAM-dependent methyltransferase [Saccharolobus islandicus]|uniref:Methyltransferase type II n=1 Tax=Saccharolobus islandicus (strain REY15A) TaxID=930945 RepID=F0NBU2_SACI5|nr:class I SAM-dependent methyltransferase [Sulfolobus islandicus]ADX85854.1 methyltransferase type II [Sulfolobus islandicus REY15A]
MLDEFLWHIRLVEHTSELEAYYIHSLIKYYEIKLNDKYNTILDVPCGYGRHHKYLRELGYDVYGIDSSTELINKAKTIYEKYGNKYFIADMRNFELNRPFDVILNWFSSFGYFEDEDNLRVLKNFDLHLRKNGLFVIELANSKLAKSRLREREYIEYIDYGEYVEILRNFLIDDRHALFNEKFYKKSGNDLTFEKEVNIKIRLYEINELNEILKEVGFKILGVLETLTFKKFSEEKSYRVTLVSSKE